MPLNIFKRSKPETDLETKEDTQKQKQTQDLDDIKETLTRLADRLERIEAKVDLVATKADRLDLIESKVDLVATKADRQAVLISLEGKQVPDEEDLNKAAKEKVETDSKNTPKKETDGGSRVPSIFNSRDKTDTKNTPSFHIGANKDAKNTPSFYIPAKKRCFRSRIRDSGGRGGGGPSSDGIFSSNFRDGGGGGPSSDGGNGEIFGGNDDQTIIVKGFNRFLREDDVKSALSKHFSSCGEITSIVVPTDQVTRGTKGCAYIQLKEGVEKALKLNGSDMEGLNLVVEKVVPTGAVGSRFGPSGKESQWQYSYRCNGLGQCSFC
ncbi:hypothetical protein AALP_AA2G137000 [Arabis alpina]|uniref:RRM domain-containing protein n=1 Tax=Arabis alpina TaxID=50452 RepID=A0A087HH87_ARAAL|nr:hypothetical protein AALP_AA2G137000 [Arabis alpina]